MIDSTTATTLSTTQRTRSRTVLKAAAVPLTLVVLGAASVWLYFWGRDLHRFTQWIAAYIGLFIGQLAFYAVACLVVLRWSGRSSRAATWATLAAVFLFAIAFRAVLVPQRPYLSSDVYRYVWDGSAQRAGINPYRYVPEAGELTGVRDERIYPNINPEDRRWLSPYPPVAQFVFFGVALVQPNSVTAFKAATTLFDTMTIVLLMLVLARSGLDPARAIFFAWHPLLVFEGAHSGHIEAVFIAFLALALLARSHRKPALTGVALALATLVKFYPVLLLAVFLVAKPRESIDAAHRGEELNGSRFAQLFRRVIHEDNLAMLAAFVATTVLAYVPYLSAGKNLFGFVRGYALEEGFVQSGARYFLLDAARKLVPVPTTGFLILSAACMIAVALLVLVRVKRDAVDVARGATLVIGLFLLLTTPRYAWYYAWLVPFLCLVPRVGWLYLTSSSVLLYLLWYTPMVYPEIPLALGAAIYGPTMAWLAWEWWTGPRYTHPQKT